MPIVELEGNTWFIDVDGTQTKAAEAWVYYNDANNRITTIEWQIYLNNVLVYPQIFIDDVLEWEPPNQVPLTFGSGSENVPGNLRAQLYTDSPPDYYGVPDNVIIRVRMWTVEQIP